MHASPITWLLRFVWLTLPLTLGDLFGEALEDRSRAVVVVTLAIAWLIWAAGLLASLVQQPTALLVLRVLAPVPAVAAAVVALDTAPGVLGWIGLAGAVVAATAAMSAEVGYESINGAAYGDEARFPLRPPAALLLGPVELAWALTALPLPIGLVALAARAWVAGAALVVLGAATAWWGLRVLARLARRWCVFVPAGVTLVDDMAVAEPTLVRSGDIAGIGPAPADTAALDLSAGASGLIVQVDLVTAVELVPAAPRGGVTEARGASAFLLAPSRPGALLRHARSRGIGALSDAAG